MSKREQFLRVLIASARRFGFRGASGKALDDMSGEEMEDTIQLVRLGDASGNDRDAIASVCVYDAMPCACPAQAVQQDSA